MTTPDLQSSPQEEAIYRNELSFTHLGGTALNPAILIPNEAHEQVYETMLDQNRDLILRLPRNEAGLDLGHISNYRQKIGAPKKELLFLDPDEYDKALAIDGGDEHSDHTSKGRYLQDVDVIVVKRDSELEGLNGVEVTESAAVHEIAHSSAILNPIQLKAETTGRFRKKTEVIGDRSRTGFVVTANEKVKGTLLEEGYAEYERGQYMLEQGRKGGFVTAGEDFDRNRALELIPGQYYILKRDAEDKVEPAFLSNAAVAAATLELLAAQDDKLTDALRESRKSSDGLREVAQRINAIVPGMYQKMHDVDINADDGMQKASALLVEVYKATVSAK
jgi:hypothetical protein